jgi:hypothetical protein
MYGICSVFDQVTTQGAGSHYFFLTICGFKGGITIFPSGPNPSGCSVIVSLIFSFLLLKLLEKYFGQSGVVSETSPSREDVDSFGRIGTYQPKPGVSLSMSSSELSVSFPTYITCRITKIVRVSTILFKTLEKSICKTPLLYDVHTKKFLTSCTVDKLPCLLICPLFSPMLLSVGMTAFRTESCRFSGVALLEARLTGAPLPCCTLLSSSLPGLLELSLLLSIRNHIQCVNQCVNQRQERDEGIR